VTCLEETEVDGLDGGDAMGSLLYDLITLNGLELGALLSVAAPILADLKEPQVQTLLEAVLEALIEDVGLRDLAIDLVVFLLREDNLLPVLESVQVLVETRGADDLIQLVQRLTIRCPEAKGE
jgi:hypothetical protein